MEPKAPFFCLKMVKKSANTSRLLRYLCTVLIILLIISIWEILVHYYNLPKRILPAPSQIADYLVSDFTSGKFSILTKSLNSTRDALLGYSLSLLLGITTGIIFTHIKVLNVIFAPFILITQLLPVPAFAPVIASVLGYGTQTKIFIIVLFTIFPVIITTESAIRSISKNYINLFKTYNASFPAVFKKLVIPAIVPDLLTIMKILTTASIVTSIISELPLTVSGGIGKDIYNSFNNQITTRVWASLIIISTISILFFFSVLKVERNIINLYRYVRE